MATEILEQFIHEEFQSKKHTKEGDFVEVLKLFSPGTSLRNAIDDILRANMGALIIVERANVMNLVDGGFRVNTKFSQQKLVELAKMDGAIILSKDLKKILYANTLLYPDINISTKETGTRHRAAERTAKQTGTIVIAVSERKRKITLYYGHMRYELSEGSEILRRATETLQILEKQKEVFYDNLANLNISEVSNSVEINDVCNVLQNIEIISRISDIVRRYLVELGKEGIIVSMRLKELTKNLGREKELIVEDYFGPRAMKINSLLENISFDSLLELSNLQRGLFGESHEKMITPKGKRIISKLNLEEDYAALLLSSFENLGELFNADESILSNLVDNRDVKTLLQEIESLREKILIGKRI